MIKGGGLKSRHSLDYSSKYLEPLGKVLFTKNLYFRERVCRLHGVTDMIFHEQSLILNGKGFAHLPIIYCRGWKPLLH